MKSRHPIKQVDHASTPSTDFLIGGRHILSLSLVVGIMHHYCGSCATLFCLSLFTVILRSWAVAQTVDLPVNSTDSKGNTTLSVLELPTDSLLNYTGRGPECSNLMGLGYQGVTMESCLDLIEQIPDTQAALVDQNGEKLELPIRFSSCK